MGNSSLQLNFDCAMKDAAERLGNLQDALNRISHAATSMGISMQEAVAATNAYVNKGFGLSDAAEQALNELIHEADDQASYNTMKELIDYTKHKTKAQDYDEDLYGIPRFNLDDYKVDIESFCLDEKEMAPVQVGRSENQPEQKTSGPRPVKICLAHDTEEAWRTSTRILLPGEVALIETPTSYYAVVGDGVHTALECKRLSLF